MRKVYLFGLVGFIICFWGLTQVFAANLCVNLTGAMVVTPPFRTQWITPIQGMLSG